MSMQSYLCLLTYLLILTITVGINWEGPKMEKGPVD